RQGIYDPEVLVDVSGIEEMRGVAVQDGFLRLGGATPLAQVEASDLVRAHLPALAECLGDLATPLVREAATVAGDLCQEKRCWFFRSRFPFWAFGGATCPCCSAGRQSPSLDPRCATLRGAVPGGSGADAPCPRCQNHHRGRGGRRSIAMDRLYRWSASRRRAGRGHRACRHSLDRSCTSAFRKFALRRGDFCRSVGRRPRAP
ncbi:MAG: FAD binding domain-containing protein, partial [Betaproteobacteria bacterium]|nr:FAD binding domain-containing protein [Betaproteobacteria bacterium]